ncbi:TetR/AcrR family transcriptional regulator [Fictibacillus iocasae]|uniref:TetR/AcrR family transcriptional regulator n=1 Tax=Fictibacillus iocasae TaxID=2715437 RepID=A0ABW2NQK0_9BACL
MGEAMDRRKKKTKQELRKALLQLIEEKGMEKVTVSDLSERADINRGTFYLHYRDVFDFVEKIQIEILEGLAREIGTVQITEVKTYAENGQAFPPVLTVLRYLAKHFDFFRVMFGPNGDASFPGQFKEFMKQHIYQNAVQHMTKQDNIPQDYLFAFMSSAQLGLLSHWIDTEMSLRDEEIAIFITNLLYFGPVHAAGLFHSVSDTNKR